MDKKQNTVSFSFDERYNKANEPYTKRKENAYDIFKSFKRRNNRV